MLVQHCMFSVVWLPFPKHVPVHANALDEEGSVVSAQKHWIGCSCPIVFCTDRSAPLWVSRTDPDRQQMVSLPEAWSCTL